MNNVNFFELVGKTIVSMSIDSDSISIETSDGCKYQAAHSQDCCESVVIENTIGNIESILDSPITLAEEDGSANVPTWYKGDESGTWTSYFLQTVNGRLEVWWLGQSNGYYGEGVDFYRTNS